jgi:hypothetical protein
MAAAAMTPRSLETAFKPFNFPGVSFISPPMMAVFGSKNRLGQLGEKSL